MSKSNERSVAFFCKLVFARVYHTIARVQRRSVVKARNNSWRVAGQNVWRINEILLGHTAFLNGLQHVQPNARSIFERNLEVTL